MIFLQSRVAFVSDLKYNGLIIQGVDMTSKQNWFNTLNEALESEGLIESWDCMAPGILYGETRSYTWQDGTRYGHLVSIFRNNEGRYERPVHYTR